MTPTSSSSPGTFVCRTQTALRTMADRVHVAGIPVDNLDMDEALAVIESFVASRDPAHGCRHQS